MQWQVVVVAGIAGLMALVLAFVVDRRNRARRAVLVDSPPDRDIPGLPEGARPAYVSDSVAGTAPPGAPSTELSHQARDELKRRCASSPSIPAGWANRRFVTDSAAGWAVVSSPRVLVAQEIRTVREMLPVLERIGRDRTAVVVVAGVLAPEVRDTLAVNVVQRYLQAVAVETSDLDTVAHHTHAQIVTREDLQAGWLPELALGWCDNWISGSRESWILGAE